MSRKSRETCGCCSAVEVAAVLFYLFSPFSLVPFLLFFICSALNDNQVYFNCSRLKSLEMEAVLPGTKQAQNDKKCFSLFLDRFVRAPRVRSTKQPSGGTFQVGSKSSDAFLAEWFCWVKYLCIKCHFAIVVWRHRISLLRQLALLYVFF